MQQKKDKLTVNFLYQVAYQLLTIILPLVTAPYISRVLGPENTGIYSYTFVIANYFLVFAALGIETYGNRTIARVKSEGQDKINYTFTTLFLMHAIVSIIAIIIYAVYIVYFLTKYRLIASLQGLLVISALFDVNWFFFGIEEFKLTVTRNMLIKLSTVIAMFVFVRTSDDLWKYTLIMSLGVVISQSVIWFFLPKYVRFVKVKFFDVINHLKPLCILFLAVVATSLYRMIDKLMLGWFGNMNSLGAYEYADRLMRMVVTLITALGTVMLPRMSALYAQRQQEQAKKYLNSTSQFMFVMSFALAFGLAGIAKEFVPIFLGKGYGSTSVLVQVLAISLPLMGWNNLVRTQILMPTSKDMIYTRAVWAGAIIDVILNAILISTIGSIGAAISTVIAYLVVSCFQTIPLKNEYDIRHLLKYSLFPLFSGCIMFVVVRTIGNKLGISFITIVAEIICGAIVYILLNVSYLWKTQNKILLRFCKDIFFKFKERK